MALLSLLVLVAQAEAPKADADERAKEQQAKWNAYYAKTAADYEITRGKERAEKLKLEPGAALHWSNPVRGGETNGSVFI